LFEKVDPLYVMKPMPELSEDLVLRRVVSLTGNPSNVTKLNWTIAEILYYSASGKLSSDDTLLYLTKMLGEDPAKKLLNGTSIEKRSIVNKMFQ
jgi:hypothetical protein